LSLSHLAAGVAHVTGAGPSDGCLMAVGIDLGFIAFELAELVAPAEKRAAAVRYAAPAIAGTLRMQAVFDLSGDRARAGNWR